MQEELRSLLEKMLGRETVAGIQNDTLLFETGLIDSLKLLELITAIEERFDTVIPNSELLPENFGTISTLGRYLQRKKGTGEK